MEGRNYMDLKPLNNKGESLSPLESNKKAIIIASVIVGVLLLGGISYGVYYKVSNTSKQVENKVTNTNNSQVLPSNDTNISKTSDTSDWQTYKNDSFGFEIQYPKTYTFYTVKDGVFTIKSPAQKGGYDMNIQVNQDSSLNNLSLDQIINNKVKSISIKEQQKTTFAGQTAYEGVSTGMVNEYILISKKGNNVYELLLNTGNKDSLAENKAALDINQKQIINTFKFINSTLEDFSVRELDIKFKVAKELKDDLIYSYRQHTDQTTGKSYKVALFSTKTLKNKDKNCAAEAAPLGAFSKYEGKKADYGNPYLENRDSEIKQFDTFFVRYARPQAPCNEDIKYETNQLKLFNENLPGEIEEIK